MSYSIISVCGGNGIVTYPFDKDNIIANIEPRRLFHTKHLEQWELNFKDIPYFKSLNDYKEAGNMPKSIDYLIGAPNCGHSSILSYSRAKQTRDPEGDISIQQFYDSVLYFLPKVFLMENLTKFKETPTFNRLEDELSEAYEFIGIEGSVSKFGNSQVHRNRLIWIGIRKDQPRLSHNIFSNLKVDKPKLLNSKMLEEKSKGYSDNKIRESKDHKVPMVFEGKQLTLGEVKKIWRNQYRDKARWEMPGTKMKNLPGVYRNLPFKPPMTARKETRQFDSKGNCLSPRQLATIQGVPGDFKLYFDEERLNYWINKARVTVTKCPPYEIGLWFYKQIEKYENN